LIIYFLVTQIVLGILLAMFYNVSIFFAFYLLINFY